MLNHSLFGENFLWVQIFLFSTSSSYFSSCLYVFVGFPGGSDGKESACNVGDLGSVPGQGRSPGEGKGYPLQYSGLGPYMGHKQLEMTERLLTSLGLPRWRWW